MTSQVRTGVTDVKARQLGYVHGDGLQYLLDVDENGVQTAYTSDLAFLRKGRITPGFDLKRPFPGTPDLAVEVASPGQKSSILLDKVADYLRCGTEEVWMIYPPKRELHRHRRDEQVPEVYRESDILQSETLFPGLAIRISDLFIVEE